PSAGQTTLRVEPMKEELRSRKEPESLINIGRRSLIKVGCTLTQQGTQENSAYAQLSEHDVLHFLKRLVRAATLDGYWTQTFLAFVSQNYPMACLEFLFARIDYAVANPNTLGSFRPCNHGPYIDVPLRFRKSKDFGMVVREVVRHITEMPDASMGSPVFALHAAELFDAVCAPFDDELVSYLEKWISASTSPELRLIAQTLSHAGSNFVFEQRAFVTRFLQRAQGFGTEALKDAMGALVSSAVSGVNSGVPGQPYPQDIDLRDKAEGAMKTVPRVSPSYLLYERLKKIADENITLTMRQSEFMTT
ncbi:MAG: hypothetical protein WAU56_10500, partial [Steroidobacteraceae bacterium]